jgi:hypothetical protein
LNKGKPRVRVGLIVRREHTTGYNAGFFHVYASPVTINDPNSYRSGSERGDIVRNPSYDRSVNGLQLDDLRVSCQGNNEQRREEDGRPKVYAWEVEYHSPHRVDRDRAEGMAKTLAAIERRLKALRERFGAPGSYGQFVARVAAAIGADTILRDNNRAQWHPDADYQQLSVGAGADYVDRIIAEWAAEADPKKEEVA